MMRAAFAAVMALLRAPAIALATYWTHAAFVAVMALLRATAIVMATVLLQDTIVMATA